MEPSIENSISNIVHQYGQVAEAVNRREMQRFIQEVRDRWHPEPPEWWDPHPEGYTDAGAFALCVYQRAFRDYEPEQPKDTQLSEAERQNKVLFHPPLNAFVDEIPKPLSSPLPQDQIDEELTSLKEALQQQYLDSSGPKLSSPLELPEGFETLMRLTNGLHAAGVPAETGFTQIVYPLEEQEVKAEEFERVRSRTSRFEKPLAGWRFGGCEQYRDIYFVLCSRPDGLDAIWRIWDIWHAEMFFHHDLAQFLQKETTFVEGRPGGAQRLEIITNQIFPCI